MQGQATAGRRQKTGPSPPVRNITTPGAIAHSCSGFSEVWCVVLPPIAQQGAVGPPPRGPHQNGTSCTYLELPDVPLGHQVMLVLWGDAIGQSL